MIKKDSILNNFKLESHELINLLTFYSFVIVTLVDACKLFICRYYIVRHQRMRMEILTLLEKVHKATCKRFSIIFDFNVIKINNFQSYKESKLKKFISSDDKVNFVFVINQFLIKINKVIFWDKKKIKKQKLKLKKNWKEEKRYIFLYNNIFYYMKTINWMNVIFLV